METISTKTQVAKKVHFCDYCNGIIFIGDKYESQFNKHDGSAYTWKNHIHCSKIATELKMHEDSDYGVDSDTFHECINNEFISITDENDMTIPTFEEKLKKVLEFHKIKFGS